MDGQECVKAGTQGKVAYAATDTIENLNVVK